MIQCKECGARHYPGTLFCSECGRFLGEEQGLPETVAATAVQHVRFLLPQSGRQLQLDLTSPIWIGRADPEAGFWPRLDLTPESGVELGVSRRHALIQRGSQGVTLVDKSSANGTWVDGHKLEAERPFPLPHKAQIRFGKLRVQLFLE